VATNSILEDPLLPKVRFTLKSRVMIVRLGFVFMQEISRVTTSFAKPSNTVANNRKIATTVSYHKESIVARG